MQNPIVESSYQAHKSGSLIAPAVIADQWHEPAAKKLLFLELMFGCAGYSHQHLAHSIPDRYHQAAADCQLIKIVTGHIGSTRRDDASIKGGHLLPTESAIRQADIDLAVATRIKGFPGTAGQRRDALQGEDLIGQHGEDSGLVAGARTDFKNFFCAVERQGLAHHGDHVGLGNRLSFTDRQRRILVGLTFKGFFDKFMPWHLQHCIDDPGIPDTASHDLVFNHAPTGDREVLHAWGTSLSESTGSSSMSHWRNLSMAA